MDVAEEKASDSDMSDSWSLVSMRPDESELSQLKGSVDSGLQSSKEFLLLDNNIDECFELTEMTLSDPLDTTETPDTAQQSSESRHDVLTNNTSAKHEWEEDSDGISVIFEDECPHIDDVQNHGVFDEIVDDEARAAERLTVAEYSNDTAVLAIPLSSPWIRSSVFPLSNLSMFAFAFLAIVVARQIFSKDKHCPYPGVPPNCQAYLSDDSLSEGCVATYECIPGFHVVGRGQRVCRDGNWSPHEIPHCLPVKEDEQQRLAAAIANLERLNSVGEALQKQMQQSLDEMAVKMDAVKHCPTAPVTQAPSVPIDVPLGQKEAQLKMTEVLPAFVLFADEKNISTLTILASRLTNISEEIVKTDIISDDIVILDQQLRLIILKLLKNPGDVTNLANRLEKLTQRIERKIKKNPVEGDLNIVQWFSSDDDVNDIFVKDEVKVSSPEKVEPAQSSSEKIVVKDKQFDLNAKKIKSKTGRMSDETLSRGKQPARPPVADKRTKEINDKQKFKDRMENKHDKRDKVVREVFPKNKYFKTKQEWLTWQLERGKARENLRRDGGKNRYYRSTGMLYS